MKTIETKPTARLAVNKSVLKMYKTDDTNIVYLKDKTEFEIELFNPLQEKILMKYSFNGESVSSQGMIINPGQRIFLERYLNKDSKFKFETYKVEDNLEVNNAINKNGNIEITFYKLLPAYNTYVTCTTPIIANYRYNNPYYTNVITTCYTNSIDNQTSASYFSSLTASNNTKEKETGRIENGSKSNQYFLDSYEDFSFVHFEMIKIKILPESEKVFTAEDVKYRKYCSECGKKVNSSDKYCSICGTKLK